eukprot:scaffold260837_cov36-Tisochrysis_lutea.AAC.3
MRTGSRLSVWAREQTRQAAGRGAPLGMHFGFSSAVPPACTASMGTGEQVAALEAPPDDDALSLPPARHASLIPAARAVPIPSPPWPPPFPFFPLIAYPRRC